MMKGMHATPLGHTPVLTLAMQQQDTWCMSERSVVSCSLISIMKRSQSADVAHEHGSLFSAKTKMAGLGRQQCHMLLNVSVAAHRCHKVSQSFNGSIPAAPGSEPSCHAPGSLTSNVRQQCI